MKKRLAVWLSGMAVLLLLSFTRPIDKLQVSSTFGESRQDHIHNGIDLSGDGQEIVSVLPGQVIFYWDEEDYPYESVLGYGNYVILQHEESFRSFYYHLKKGTIVRELIYVSEGIKLGLSGNSGHSGGPHLHFTLIDLKAHRAVNPMMYMPEITDRFRPVIEDVYYAPASVEGAVPRALAANSRFTQGASMDLLVKTYDRIQTTPFKLGVYSLTVLTNNVPFYSLQFDSIDLVSPEGAYLKSSLPYGDIYQAPYFYKAGTLTVPPGETVLKVRVADYHGNAAVVERTIMTR